MILEPYFLAIDLLVGVQESPVEVVFRTSGRLLR